MFFFSLEALFLIIFHPEQFRIFSEVTNFLNGTRVACRTGLMQKGQTSLSPSGTTTIGSSMNAGKTVCRKLHVPADKSLTMGRERGGT